MALELNSSPTPPPARTPSSRPSPGAPPKRSALATGKLKKREEAVNDIAQLAYGGAAMFGQYADAGTVALYGPEFAHELAELSDRQPKVGDAIDKLNEVSPYAAILMVGIKMSLQFAANHKLVKADSVKAFGVRDPEALAAQTKAKILHDAAEYERQVKAEMDSAAELDAMDKARENNGNS
jgi:hypothetical protein